jgi:glutaminase
VSAPDPVATQVARAELMKRVLIVVTAAMVAVALALLLVLLGRVRGTQVDNANKADARDATLLAIQDCTQPSGECFKRGQQRTASAVASIQRIIVLSAACSVRVSPNQHIAQRVAAITDCVNRGLK